MQRELDEFSFNIQFNPPLTIRKVVHTITRKAIQNTSYITHDII
jgi:hypothetical protein